MTRIGEFIYPWGSGHYTRMMRLNEKLKEKIDGAQIHVATGPPVYERAAENFPDGRVHKVQMPTPIDGAMGPSIGRSLLNVLLPVSGRPPLVRQVASYLREERKLYDDEQFDLVINDGDMGSNILARNRNIPSLFITNQFRPKLWRSRSYLYPAASFISRQIAKASRILVADSAPPYTMCEYNLNFPEKVMKKVRYVGHFAGRDAVKENSDIERLTANKEFGYWMRTGNKSTNEGTGARYEMVFAEKTMRRERRIISHARGDPAIDRVRTADGTTYCIAEAVERDVDWIQIDVGFLSETDKQTVMKRSKYAVINGSHTIMGEIMGQRAKPVIGIPVYDEHTNQIRWAQERRLGVMARNTKQVLAAISRIKDHYEQFEDALADFARNFEGGGAANAAAEAAKMLEKR